MIGAILGDIIGSVYEFEPMKEIDFPLFSKDSSYTDDTIMTFAVMDWIVNKNDLTQTMQRYGRMYPCPMGGYGSGFSKWLKANNPQSYDSWGNGSAMRVSVIGWAFQTLDETLEAAWQTAIVSHNHPEGIKGAQATAVSIFLARSGKSKEEIRQYIETTFGYNLHRSCDEIRPGYHFNESCQETVPEAIIAFLDSTDFENAIRLAVSLGGDSDTLACITGGIAEAFYGVPNELQKKAEEILPEDFIKLLNRFCYQFDEYISDGKYNAQIRNMKNCENKSHEIVESKQNDLKMAEEIIERAYELLIRKLGAGGLCVRNEMAFQIELGSILRVLGNMYEFRPKDKFSLDFECYIDLKEKSNKSGNNKARVDILIRYNSVVAAIELKFFKKENHREPNNRYDVFNDLSNLENYKQSGIDLCYFMLGTDHAHYVDPEKIYSQDTGDFDFRDGVRYEANRLLEYRTNKPYGTPICLKQNYSFKWNSINNLNFLKLKV